MFLPAVITGDVTENEIKPITLLFEIECYSWAEWPRTCSQTTLASDLAVVAALNIQANYGL